MQYKLQRVEEVVVIMLEGKLLSEQETSAIKTNIADELTGGKMKFIIDLKGIEFPPSSTSARDVDLKVKRLNERQGAFSLA